MLKKAPKNFFGLRRHGLRGEIPAFKPVALSVMHVFLLDNPEVTLTKTELDNLGVLSWKIPVETIEEDGILDGICRERNYTYKDIVRVEELLLLSIFA